MQRALLGSRAREKRPLQGVCGHFNGEKSYDGAPISALSNAELQRPLGNRSLPFRFDVFC
jgi:hypothetical protein